MEDLFPYPYREEQEELVQKIHDEVWDSNICLHAPTGFGKTPVILAALLPYIDYNIVWTVRTGNETDRPIEELKIINRESGEDFFGFSYRGKRDMCILAKEIDMGGEPSYSDVSFLCREQGKDCPYRRNLERINPVDIAKNSLLYSELLELSKNLEICPYYAQQRLLPLADVVSLSYNYVVNEQLGWVIKRSFPYRRSFLVVDEAHNLQKACSSMNSDQITLRTLNRSLNELEKIDNSKSEELMNLVLLMAEKLEEVERNVKEESVFDARGFLESLISEWDKDPVSLRLSLDQLVTYGTQIRRKQLEEGKRPRSSLNHLGRFWLRLLDNLKLDGITFLAKRERGTLIVEIWDMRSAEILKDRWGEFRGCVFCSGTLKPFRAFAATAGLEKVKGLSTGSFYNSRNILSLIPSGLTTEGKELSDSMARRYVDSLVGFARGIKSNVAAFCSSYRIQRALLNAGLKEEVENEGMTFYQERRGMDGALAREILDEFKRQHLKDEPGFLCATAMGRFAEGADFPGKELEGIFLVGIPFDRMSVRTELYLEYYRKLYGKRNGMYYGYIVPALRRASQALGRLLRSKDDKGVLVCGDQRYGDRRFFRLLPDFVRNNSEGTKYDRLEEDVKPWVRSFSGS